jgi:hypothetical protein
LTRWRLILFLGCLTSAVARGEAESTPNRRGGRDSFGAVVAPATLPSTASSAYAYIGVQEVGAGYRHGFEVLELEARARLNYFLISTAAEILAKYSLFQGERGGLAPFVGLGFVYNAGRTYYDEFNFEYVGIRTIAGLMASLRLGEHASLVGEVDVPVDFSLNASGGLRFNPLAGGGVEFGLSEDTTMLVMGQLGLDLVKGPNGAVQNRLGYQIRLGIGFRLF